MRRVELLGKNIYIDFLLYEKLEKKKGGITNAARPPITLSAVKTLLSQLFVSHDT